MARLGSGACTALWKSWAKAAMKALRTSKVLIGTGEASWSNAVACHRDITRASTIRKPLRQRITGEVQIGQHRPRRLSLAASNWLLSRYPCSKPITSVPISICVVAKAEVRKDKQQSNKTKAKTKKNKKRKTKKNDQNNNKTQHAAACLRSLPGPCRLWRSPHPELSQVRRPLIPQKYVPRLPGKK